MNFYIKKLYDLCDANQVLSALIDMKCYPKMTFDTCNMYSESRECIKGCWWLV